MDRSQSRAATLAAQPETNPWSVLFVISVGIFMLLLDTTVVNVAQRKIQEGLNANLSEIQWILDAYILTFAVLLLAFGRLGDILGRKRLFVIGLIIFTTASVLCGASAMIADITPLNGPQALIASRVLQGFGGAMMMPQTLSMVMVAFPHEKRGAALGVWSGIIGLGAVVGPILGGFIVTDYAWEWIFLVNLPVGIIATLFAIRILPESTDPQASRTIDWGGVALSGLGLFALVYGLIEAPHKGWGSSATILTLVASAVLLVGFVFWELRQRDPIMKLELFKIWNFSVAMILTTATSFGIFGIFFPMTLFLQAGLGFSPIRAGLTLVPMSVTMMVTAPIVGKVLDRLNPRWFMVVGLSLVTVGVFLIIGATTVDATWKTLFFPAALTGLGMGMTFTPLTTAAMKEVPPRISGSASGIINTLRNIGQVLGIAVLGSLLQSQAGSNARDRIQPLGFDSGVVDQIVNLTRDTRLHEIPGVLQATQANRIPEVMGQIQLAFIDAVQGTFLICAAVIAVAVPIALTMRSATGPATAPAGKGAANESSQTTPVAYPVGE
jgi:EmrB/QacA subfamily drug resistance transporter